MAVQAVTFSICRPRAGSPFRLLLLCLVVLSGLGVSISAVVASETDPSDTVPVPSDATYLDTFSRVAPGSVAYPVTDGSSVVYYYQYPTTISPNFFNVDIIGIDIESHKKFAVAAGSDSDGQTMGGVDAGIAVWTRTSGWPTPQQVIGTDIRTERQFQISAVDDQLRNHSPSISGEWVTWSRSSTNETSIMARNIDTMEPPFEVTKIESPNSLEAQKVSSDGQIVWLETRVERPNDETRIEHNRLLRQRLDEDNPTVIYETRMVTEPTSDFRFAPRDGTKIWYFDVSGNSLIFTELISGDPGALEVVLLDLSTGARLVLDRFAGYSGDSDENRQIRLGMAIDDRYAFWHVAESTGESGSFVSTILGYDMATGVTFPALTERLTENYRDYFTSLNASGGVLTWSYEVVPADPEAQGSNEIHAVQIVDLRPAGLSPASHFQRTWDRTDKPVADGVVDRTWIWGAQVSDLLTEEYVESPDGQRTVQYFDKSRMEITHPDISDPESIWYVTNGLLAVELISGQRQSGDDTFVQYLPSEQNVAGDQGFPNGPSYASFLNVWEAYNPNTDSLLQPDNRTGSLANLRLGRSGEVSLDEGLDAEDVQYAFFDEVTGHNIAGPFWEFMNSSGPVWEDGMIVEDRLFPNAFYATGRPVSEAYWSDVVVNGSENLVLIQCFERRCLTYTPDNPEGWQVEAGNIGQHYHAWRYQEQPPLPEGQLLVADDSYDSALGQIDSLSVLEIGSGDLVDLTGELQGRISDQSWSPDGNQIVFSYHASEGAGVVRDSGGDIYVMVADGSNLRQLTSGGHDVDPAWSPDGSQIAFSRGLVFDSLGDVQESQIFLIDADGSNERQLTFIPPAGDPWQDLVLTKSPVWSPDGTRIAFFGTDWDDGLPPGPRFYPYIINSDGTGLQRLDWFGYAGSLAWSPDGVQLLIEEPMGGGRDLDGSALWLIEPGSEARLLAGNDKSNPHSAIWSPDGSQIAVAWGIRGIGLINVNGSVLMELPTLTPGVLSWSPDGQHIAYGAHSFFPYSNVRDELVVVWRIADGQQWIVARDGYQPLWRP